MIERVKDFYEENEELIKEGAIGFARGVAIGLITSLAMTGLVLNMGYWLGHPEKVLKKEAIDMIIKNVGE